MASQEPIDEEYLNLLRTNTGIALGWLLEEIKDGRASSHYDKFNSFAKQLDTLSLAEIVAVAPAIEGGPHSTLSEWDCSTNTSFREEWCRVFFFHQTYYDLASKFRLYHEFRIKRSIDLPSRDIIESKIIERLRQVDESHRISQLTFWQYHKERLFSRKGRSR